MLRERQVREERRDQEHVPPPQHGEAGLERALGERCPKRHRKRRGHEGPRLVAVAGELERLGQQFGGDDPADHPEDDQGIAVEREPGGPRDEPAPERPGDAHQDDHRDDVLHRADCGPQEAVERDRQHALDEPARDDVGGPDRQQDEAPEDARVHEPGAQVAEHPALDEGVLDQAREPPRDVGERARARGARRGEHPQVAGHREREERRRAPEQHEDQRVAGHLGERLEHGQPEFVRFGCGLAPWSCGPASVSSAWSSSGTRASSDSSAPFGLPGRLTISARPRTPTTPRDRSANGCLRPPCRAHGLAHPGHLVVDDGLRRLWRDIARREAGAAGGYHERVTDGGCGQRPRDPSLLIGDDHPLDPEAELLQATAHVSAGRILAVTACAAVACGQHER